MEAVKAIQLPEEINDENREELSKLVSAAVEASEKLSEEELALEDVKTALALMDEAVKALSNISTTEEPVPVAKIGDTEFPSLDEAVAAADDGAVIELLADCETEGLNLSKNLTIKGGYTVTFTKYGIALWGKSLTFDGCTVLMNGIGSTPYTAEWSWMTICASKGASLNLNNAAMTLDGTGAGNVHAIYFCSDNKLNLNGSSLTIRNYAQDALEWDGGDGGYNVNIINSSYTSDHNRSGFTGTFYVTADNSTVSVVNSAGNGSNGSHFIIRNGSVVDFSGNGSHGLSAGLLSVDSSTVTANNNGMCGVIFTGAGTFVNSDITITGTRGISYWNAGMRLYTANATASIDGNTRLTISDNYVTGLYLDSSSSLSIAEGAQVLITRNRAEQANCSTAKDFALCGGGIAVRSGASAALSSTTQIYNNHAALAGDDIYVEDGGSISFGPVGSGWTLDDCSHAIDGWYDDSANVTEGDSTTYNRWNAHDSAKEHIVLSAPGSYTGVTALKAAHGILPPAEPLPWPDSPDNISRSKTATNLDANFESTVTLGLPAAEQQLVSDVVFVLDKSTSAQVESQVLDMLSQLNEQIKGSSAAVKVGVVIFNKQANNVLELTELNDANLSTIESAIQTKISSGTNTHAGLLAGRAMLDADSSVDAGRKYLIFVSDGISYIFDAEANSINSQQMTTGEYAIMAGPDCWGIRHYQEGAQSYVPEDFGSYLGTVGLDLSMVQQYIQPYASTSSNQALHIPRDNGTAYPSCVDVALYKTAITYQSAVGSGYNCYAVTADTGSASANPWGPAFMSYLAQGHTVNFEGIKNDILYLLSAGSTVEDYIGSGTDDKGNAYNMDFVNDLSRLSLTVGGVELDKVQISETEYGFGARDGSYRFVLEYFPDSAEGADDEHFVWYINESIKITEPVQLSYVVKLANPQTADGTYGEYDANGSQSKTALYTNNSATLYPVDSSGAPGVPQIFPKPTVSYTVAPSLITVSVTKIWNDSNNSDGIRPASLTVTLYADGKNTGKTLVLNEANNWQGSFDALPAAENNTAIDYKVYEDEVPGYTAQASVSEASKGITVTLTNTHIVETVSIPVQKVWQDNNNAYGRRPNSVTVYLYANGEYTDKVLILSRRGGWVGSFDNLPRYSNGQPIEYTVREKSMYFYNGKVSVNPEGGFIVTNYYTTTPGTGDGSNLWLWLAVCAGSLAALGTSFVIIRKRKTTL